MLQITKIFRFETAHAIHGYPGPCSNLHGHSYRLHVTVARQRDNDGRLPPTGFIMDFKQLKRLVNHGIVSLFDHHTILSSAYLVCHPPVAAISNLWIWETEPTAENMLLYIRDSLQQQLQPDVVLRRLRLFETDDSYAEWEEDKMC
ncbi:6-carboxytetrahydropterin synthase [Asinibacterium sp. OR53]|uniref:6-pyruvoyl trahydropterin synthase family protein n=1 Tax=Asinibacterium sp. OR53 TaxID=925409 RepID=UPI00047DB564|nr:6-carboxytetrahydropterin synthase [Asinibacterium sp. OR53]